MPTELDKINQYVNLLKLKMAEATVENYQNWKVSTIPIIEQVFGVNSDFVTQLKLLRRNTKPYSTDNTQIMVDRGKTILKACILSLEHLGLPTNNSISQTSGGIVNTIHVSQTVNVNLLLGALQEELNPNQLKEIKEITDSDEGVAKKKRKIVEKLVEFGENTASNILASLITNPSIYSALFG